MALPAQGNLIGSIMMGVYPELLPGGLAAANTEAQTRLTELWGSSLPAQHSCWNTGSPTAEHKVKVLYLIGSQVRTPHSVADFVIFQNLYPPPGIGDADLVLPAAAFTEADGTFINGEGRVQSIHRAVEPPGAALPDWAILCRLAQRLGRPGFDYASALEIRKEIAVVVQGFGDPLEPERRPSPLTCEGRFEVAALAPLKAADRCQDAPFVLSVSLAEHTYRGFPLSTRVGGAAKLFAEETLDMNGADAAMLGLSSGDRAVVTGEHLERTWPVRLVNEQPVSMVHVVLQPGDESVANPYRVHIRKADV
jgi:anaerobic selenocysteine-containing dehydrogenase